MRIALAVVLAALAATLYAVSTSLQALEARSTPKETGLRASLLARLVRRRLWLAGAAAGVVAWPLQAVALSLASVAIVQPALGLGLVALLVLGVRMLGERVGPRELGGVLSIVAAVAVLAWSAPPETGAFTPTGTWFVGGLLAVGAALPWLLRATGLVGGAATSVAAGIGWAAVGLGTALVVEAVADRRVIPFFLWGIGVGLASWGTLIAEMTALQHWPATRAIPVAFGLEMAAPAALAPLLTNASPPYPVVFGLGIVGALAGAALLGSSRAVARVVAD